MSLGDEVRRLRDARGMSQRSLAALIGVSQAYVGQIEKADRSGLTAERLFVLADALGVPLEHFRPYFTGGATDPEPEPPARTPAKVKRPPRAGAKPTAVPPTPAKKPRRKPAG